MKGSVFQSRLFLVDRTFHHRKRSFNLMSYFVNRISRWLLIKSLPKIFSLKSEINSISDKIWSAQNKKTSNPLRTRGFDSACLPAKAGLIDILVRLRQRLRPTMQRRRDSNPRNLAVQRFSRPPHSTALPLLCVFCGFLGVQMYTFRPFWQIHAVENSAIEPC